LTFKDFEFGISRYLMEKHLDTRTLFITNWHTTLKA